VAAAVSRGPDLATLLLSLPFALVADRRLHTDLLARHYPSFAHLPIDAKLPGRGDPHGGSGAMRSARPRSPARQARWSRGRRRRPCGARAGDRTQRAVWFLPKVMHLLDDVEPRGFCVFSGRARAFPERRVWRSLVMAARRSAAGGARHRHRLPGSDGGGVRSNRGRT
jgi:hypothetical protein